MRIREPVVVALLAAASGACRSDPTPVESLTIEAGIGLRDWIAVAPAGSTDLRWTTDGRPTVEGGRLPADQLWPGETWTLSAQSLDGTAQTATATVPEPPGGNVVVLLIDDVGVDKVSAYGHPDAPETPSLDRLADTGLRFDRAYALPVCSPTRGVLLTGRHARRSGVGWIADTTTRNYALPYESLTLPEALWEARSAEPWTDAALGKWHLAGPLHPDVLEHPNASGFRHFSGLVGNPRYADGWGYARWEQNTNGEVEVRDGYLTSATIDDAIAQIESMPEPWFLYLPLNASHGPWTPPPDDLLPAPLADDATDLERYASVLQAMDTEIGRLVEALAPYEDRTTLIVMGDNGTPGYAVGGGRNPDRQKHTVYEGGVRVPLIVTGPHVAEPGSVSDALVHVADIFPTVAHIAGVPLSGPDDALTVGVGDEARPLDGRSWLPLLADPSLPGAEWLYAEAFLPHGAGPHDAIDRRMVTDGEYRLIRDLGGDHFYAIDRTRLEDPDGPDLLSDGVPNGARFAFETLTDRMDAMMALPFGP